MRTIEIGIGTEINDAARQLVAAARKHDFADMEFNGVCLNADNRTTVDRIVQEYNAELEFRSIQYKNSPEGKAAAQKRANELIVKQKAYKTLVEKLEVLDWSSHVEVMEWLVQLTQVADDVGVKKDSQRILDCFRSHGFVAGANCNENFDEGVEENVFRYIVGQAMEGIALVGAPHPVLEKFAWEYLQNFHSVCHTTMTQGPPAHEH